MRLLWAQAIDEYRVAVVIDEMGSLLGGIAFMHSMHFDVQMPRSYHVPHIASLAMQLQFDWYEVVDSAEAFRNSKRWQEEQRKIENSKLLEAPKSA